MLPQHESALVEQYYNRGAIIDTNLCVLLFVGKIDIEKVGKHRRVKQYAKQDYVLLKRMTDCFEKLYTTPNIVTEISNIIGSGDQEIVKGISSLLRHYVCRSELEESYVPSREAVKDKFSSFLGVADVAAKIVASRQLLLITDDLSLALAAQRSGCDVINFNHIRSAGY